MRVYFRYNNYAAMAWMNGADRTDASVYFAAMGGSVTAATAGVDVILSTDKKKLTITFPNSVVVTVDVGFYKMQDWPKNHWRYFNVGSTTPSSNYYKVAFVFSCSSTLLCSRDQLMGGSRRPMHIIR